MVRRRESAFKSNSNPCGPSAPFHLAITKAAHNPVLCNIVRPFVRLISQAAPTIAERLPQARETQYSEHAQVYESILKRDPEEARRRMRKHLEIARSTILEAFTDLRTE
jgi:DNA-binding FadR family transcriptional regulator